MIRLAEVTIKSTGERVYYEVKQSWNTLYYSFDDGATWHHSKNEAYNVARDNNALHCVGEIKVSVNDGMVCERGSKK